MRARSRSSLVSSCSASTSQVLTFGAVSPWMMNSRSPASSGPPEFRGVVPRTEVPWSVDGPFGDLRRDAKPPGQFSVGEEPQRPGEQSGEARRQVVFAWLAREPLATDRRHRIVAALPACSRTGQSLESKP